MQLEFGIRFAEPWDAGEVRDRVGSALRECLFAGRVEPGSEEFAASLALVDSFDAGMHTVVRESGLDGRGWSVSLALSSPWEDCLRMLELWRSWVPPSREGERWAEAALRNDRLDVEIVRAAWECSPPARALREEADLSDAGAQGRSGAGRRCPGRRGTGRRGI